MYEYKLWKEVGLFKNYKFYTLKMQVFEIFYYTKGLIIELRKCLKNSKNSKLTCQNLKHLNVRNFLNEEKNVIKKLWEYKENLSC